MDFEVIFCSFRLASQDRIKEAEMSRDGSFTKCSFQISEKLIQVILYKPERYEPNIFFQISSSQ